MCGVWLPDRDVGVVCLVLGDAGRGQRGACLGQSASARGDGSRPRYAGGRVRGAGGGGTGGVVRRAQACSRWLSVLLVAILCMTVIYVLAGAVWQSDWLAGLTTLVFGVTVLPNLRGDQR